jgi:hypothetical protein
MTARRFPPPWMFEEANNACFIVKDANGVAVSYVYFEDEPGRRAAANLMAKDEAVLLARPLSPEPARSPHDPRCRPLTTGVLQRAARYGSVLRTLDSRRKMWKRCMRALTASTPTCRSRLSPPPPHCC